MSARSRAGGGAARGGGGGRAARGGTGGLAAAAAAGGAPTGRGSGGRSPFEYNTRPSGHTKTASYSRSEEHTSELQSQSNLVCRLLLEKKNKHTGHNLDAPSLPHSMPIHSSAPRQHLITR